MTRFSNMKEEPKALLDCVDALTALEPPTGPIDPPASPDGAPSQNLYGQVVGEVDHGAGTAPVLPALLLTCALIRIRSFNT